jgi:DNA-binding transcriptional ArsR family regulator
VDALISAAARALATGDALGALKRVALRNDPPALALRGIAMAQLGEHARARELLRQAARAFGPHEALARARCVVAEAEVALAMRDLAGSTKTLQAATATLEAHADHLNARHARLIGLRRLVLLGRLDEAAKALGGLCDATSTVAPMAAAASTLAQLIRAELALRSLDIAVARAALDHAQDAARQARIPALAAEVQAMRDLLDRPAARRLSSATTPQALRLEDAAMLLDSGALVLDACRHGLRAGPVWLPLARRPVLFTLARLLAEAWPGGVDRQALIAHAFRTRHPDDTHRARLRVEMGRLRTLTKGLARVEATAEGFALRPHDEREVIVLAPPIDGEQASLLALLADGAAWSTSALALATGASQRTVQRALAELEAAGRVRAIGQGRSRRWLAQPLAAFTTILLLPPSLPPG